MAIGLLPSKRLIHIQIGLSWQFHVYYSQITICSENTSLFLPYTSGPNKHCLMIDYLITNI